MFVFFVISAPSHAQNNPYQIHDESFRYMRQINRVLKQPEAQALCDSMIRVADGHQDVKGHCVALNLKALN